MAIIITDECINCGACEPECPNNAIYEAAVDWKYSDGTSLTGTIVNVDGVTFDADAVQDPVSDEVYYIVPDKCTECKGFHEEPQCAAVCPVDCCVPDDNHVESDERLLSKKAFMHLE
ncbi:4Fe-4S dicluster domain-containing protein [Empedobacter brevis]|nr:4Fe-4S dicluster domain-containing protein [Empedobacter brevis]MDM1073163.1 4Fe-4S dicluster domain-containing protein [Empedobacter brevis]QES91529.1 4Fe-4S dicluster domain-containing protein [Empedobacter brevis]QHC86559.1 ferredoxin [Empedobacter brevis]